MLAGGHASQAGRAVDQWLCSSNCSVVDRFDIIYMVTVVQLHCTQLPPAHESRGIPHNPQGKHIASQ